MKKLLLFFFIILSNYAFTQDFTITNFDIDLTINADGSFDVVETIDVNFSKRKRGIYKDIKTTYFVEGKKYDLDVQKIDIKDYEYRVENKKDNINIRINIEFYNIFQGRQFVGVNVFNTASPFFCSIR